jgi:RNA polymerase sigma factor (sigma-70 family)
MAVTDLYRAHGADVYRYALAVLGNHADAEDVTQTTFLNAYRALEQGVHPRKPANWLLTIASNAIKQRFRRDQARPREVELDREVAANGDESDAPSVGELLTALSKIPPQQRQAIVLREFEGRSYVEIADILGVTTSALETLLFRARRSLTEELAHQLTCTEAQQGISRAADGRLGRKEKRRLHEHLRECPDCAQFARLQERHSKALRGLALVPVPLSLAVFKGFESSAAAATLPAAAGSGIGAGAVGASAAATGSTVGGSAATTGGGFLAGGFVVKAAAVVAAAGVAGGVTVAGVEEIGAGNAKHDRPSVSLTSSSGKSHLLHSRRAQHASARGLEHGKAVARGQTGNLPPGKLRPRKHVHRTAARGRSAKSPHRRSSSQQMHGKRATRTAPKTNTVPKARHEPAPNGRATGSSQTSSDTSGSASTSSSGAGTTADSSSTRHGGSSAHGNKAQG